MEGYGGGWRGMEDGGGWRGMESDAISLPKIAAPSFDSNGCYIPCSIVVSFPES